MKKILLLLFLASFSVNGQDLKVDSGGALFVSEDSYLYVAGNLDVDASGTLTLNSTSTKFSSIILNGNFNGTSSGNITYKRYVNTVVGVGQWDLVGSPVSGLSINTFATDNGANLATNSSQYAIGVYDNANNTWSNYTTGTIGAAGNFVSGKGYQMASTPELGEVLSFTGAVATVNVDVPVQNYDGVGSGVRWNLVANPYPSYLNGNTNAHSTDNFLTVNNSIIDTESEGGLFYAVYGWDADGSGYTAYNNAIGNAGAGNDELYIAPGQAFFIAAKSPTEANISFTEAMQTVVAGNDDFLLGKVKSTSHKVVLKLYNDTELLADTSLYFKEGLGLGVDMGYDAAAFDQEAALSSRLVQGDKGIGLVINAMSAEHMMDVVVPLEINQTSGKSFKITLGTNTVPQEVNIYLEDALKGTKTLLTAGDFELTSEDAISGIGRFFVHLTTKTLSVDANESPTRLVNVFKGRGNDFITIEGLPSSVEKAAVSIYNTLGMLVKSTTVNTVGGSKTIDVATVATGVYIVKVQLGVDLFTQKIIIE